MADPGPHKRPLYPPDHDKGPVPDGPDVVAVKRAISRMGYWRWQEFDDSYSNAFAHGGADGEGVAGFQRVNGIDATGNYGGATHDKLKWMTIPSGFPNGGEYSFDQVAADLYRSYHADPAPSSPVERVRAAITSFCEQGLGETDWYYSQSRPVDVTVNPNGPVTSDCSGSVIQAFYWAKTQTGIAVPDPSQQGWSGYGNTSYYEDDWPTVTSGSYLVGDLAHYDGHVTLCYHPGTADTADWWSFGSEPSPKKVKLGYRSDLRKVVRPSLV